MKSMILLEMKCPQLSKPEATVARNQNSIGDRMEKKPWEKPGSVGGQFPSGQTNQFVPTAAKSESEGSTGSSGNTKYIRFFFKVI